MRRPALFAFLLIQYYHSSGQFFPSPGYPQNEFRDPLAIPIRLAANFGELRANHYHMGLDIRTDHRENLPVFAAADGYVCRIKIEPFGFGQAIYIRHTNGYISLYAHLNAFYPALASYVKRKQYELERWDVSLDLPPGLLTVKKGDLIAYSGNMGGSQGPHLHFEIRSAATPGSPETNLNPMLFGLPVADNVPPVFRGLSVYDRNKSFYEQTPAFVPVKKTAAGYEIALPILILKSADPGFGISGFDAQTGSNNPNGIFQGVIYDNEEAVSGFQMDRISYDETRGINAHIDYPTQQRGGPAYQLLFRMPGYIHSIYKETKPGGPINLQDGKIHGIRIELKDAYGNESNLNFKVRFQPEPEPGPVYAGKVFYPGMLDGFEASNAAFYLGPACLYDSLHLVYLETASDAKNTVSSVHRFGNTEVPLGDTMTVRIRLSKSEIQKQHVLMQWSDGEDFEVKKPQWLGDWATCSFRSFGNFQLVLDTLAPVIRVPGIVENANLRRSSRIAVIVQDNYKKVKNFRATLDGKWLLFSNDKARAFLYHFDEHCRPGRHELKIYAEDEAGNGSSVLLHFSR